MMDLCEGCKQCLENKYGNFVKDPKWKQFAHDFIEEHCKYDDACYIAYQLKQLCKERYGVEEQDLTEVKNMYNALAMSLEENLTKEIEASDDPVSTALLFSRVGNYIDFAGSSNVTPEEFVSLFTKAQFSDEDLVTLKLFKEELKTAKHFVLVADNCGEIAIDKLFVKQLQKHYPNMEVSVIVRGGLASNDATMEDAIQVGLDKVCKVYSSGIACTGCVYKCLPLDAKKVFDEADVILSKGQGNYESMHILGRKIYYCYLCKCAWFVSHFNKPKLTGMFIVES